MLAPTLANGEPVSEEYARAMNAHGRIIAAKAATETCLYELCMGLKEVHDNKYYKTLGYKTFEEYTQAEHGITRQMGHRMITAVETFEKSKNVNPGLHFNGVKKFALLSTITEDQQVQLVQTVDIESTSTRKLQEEIRKLKAETAEKDALLAEKDDRIATQAAHVKELEERPLENSAADVYDENSFRKAYLDDGNRWRDMYRAEQDRGVKERQALYRELTEKHKAETAELTRSYEEKIKELSAPTAEVVEDKSDLQQALFNVHFDTAYSSVETLVEYVKRLEIEGVDGAIYSEMLSKLQTLKAKIEEVL